MVKHSSFASNEMEEIRVGDIVGQKLLFDSFEVAVLLQSEVKNFFEKVSHRFDPAFYFERERQDDDKFMTRICFGLQIFETVLQQINSKIDKLRCNHS